MKWVTIALLAACSAPPHPAPATSSTMRPRATGAIEAAGVYWVPYVTCDDCPRPAALVAYVTPSEATARTIVTALAGELPLGFPYVIHTDEIHGGSERGIAVVTGAYASLAAARTAQPRTIAGQTSRVIELDADPYPTAESPRHVTVIDRGSPVRAWSKADVDRVYAMLDETQDPAAHASFEAMHAWLRRTLAERAPACIVEPGALFVAEESELHWYDFAPVRCGATLAYVPWTSTLLGHAVIVPDGDGHKLSQVVGAECDSPIIESWPYGPNGRGGREGDELVASAGC